jgi:serine O-acetyltransferase
MHRVVSMVIRSKADYNFFLEADKIALLCNCQGKLARSYVRRNLVWRYQRLLRKVEFLGNCERGLFGRFSYLRESSNLDKLGVKLGFTIPPNVFGPGLSIAHRGTIVVHADSKVGENCRIHHCVTIGSGRIVPNDSPSIGNNVFVGAGATIVGKIAIADGIAIGANSYVNTSFQEPNITIAGCPAKKISNKSSEDLWIRATDILRRSGT